MGSKSKKLFTAQTGDAYGHSLIGGFPFELYCPSLLTDPTKFGDLNHDQIIDQTEKSHTGFMRIVYYVLLLTHIPLAGIILPFILFTAFRALTGDYDKHKELARVTWPVWFYVAVSGVLVYLLIEPYY